MSKIIILAAMGSETAALTRVLPDIPIIGTGVGKVAAASATTKAILEYRPSGIVFVGVAGGLSPDLAQLSVLVAKDALQWDVDLTPINGGQLGTLNDGRGAIATHTQGTALALEAARELGYHSRLGRVVTGDAFLANSQKSLWLQQTFMADAVEMEGAAALQVADDFNVPMVLIRVISDSANDEAALTYSDFLPKAAERAALVTEHFLPRWLETL